jgi:hypothetical protein
MARIIKIHPALGVARLGRSPDDFFVGPEIPLAFDIPAGGYRDAAGRLKRQGARFRVFVYEDNKPPRELTAAEASIRWTVHLVNSKAAADRFVGVNRPSQGLRNVGVARTELILDAGPVSLNAPGSRTDLISNRTFNGKSLKIKLGTMVPEPAGSLVVLGGHGIAGSPTNAPLEGGNNDFANRDGWFDDTSDGPVTARVTFADGSGTVEALPAWVIVAPPSMPRVFSRSSHYSMPFYRGRSKMASQPTPFLIRRSSRRSRMIFFRS